MPRSPITCAHGLVADVVDMIAHASVTTHAAKTAAEAVTLGMDISPDQTNAFLAIALWAGIPARHVSHYLHASENGNLHEAAHDWEELWIAGLGWGVIPQPVVVRMIAISGLGPGLIRRTRPRSGASRASRGGRVA